MVRGLEERGKDDFENLVRVVEKVEEKLTEMDLTAEGLDVRANFGPE